MNVTGKTKDTYKSREELNDYCRRPELKRDLVTGKFPKACYTLDKPARETLCEWVRNLKFPDGYASNMSRCVDMKKLKLFEANTNCISYLRKLKNNVKNKAKVEGSISNAYLVEEASSFCSYYFEDHVSTKHRNVPRNADGSEYVVDEHEETLSIFKYSGRAFSKAKARYMTDEEYKAAQTYVLLNCSEVEPFIE
nr:uncharacterized protein LOC109179592 [Ipomoea batatas]